MAANDKCFCASVCCSCFCILLQGLPVRRIDSHHHLWRYSAEEYGWIDDSMSVLRRDFLLEDLQTVLSGTDVAGTIAVQARQTVEETRWLLDLAAPGSPILGVCGWLPLAADDFPAQLARFAGNLALKALRHVVQAEPAGFLDGDAFNCGIRALRDTELVYEILIYANQLEEAIRFVDRHPEQPFVLDHIAKPDIRSGEIAKWSAGIRELARRPNVDCKLSGMVTEADFTHWTVEQLTPYFDVALDAFSPGRLLAGTDWPVLTVGCTYAKWWKIIESWIAPLSPAEQALVLGKNAERVYRLRTAEPESHAALHNVMVKA